MQRKCYILLLKICGNDKHFIGHTEVSEVQIMVTSGEGNSKVEYRSCI